MKERLPLVMELEADRMQNLVLTDENVLPELTWCRKSAASAPTMSPAACSPNSSMPHCTPPTPMASR